MIKSLLGGMRTTRRKDHKAAHQSSLRRAASPAEVQTLVEYFTLGKKLRYYPEFKRDIVFETMVVAYCVNDQFVYARDAVVIDEDGDPAGFLLGEEKKLLPIAKVREFHLLVPDTTDQEMTLDYHRRAQLGRHQFARGNAITLIANAAKRGVAVLDTEVAKQLAMKDGPYANDRLIQLLPDAASLNFIDNRKRSRSVTRVPVDLYPRPDASACACTLADFSESTVRLRIDGKGATMPEMQAGDAVIVVIDLGESAKTYSIRAVVVRSSADACVLRLEELHKNNKFVRFSTMDSLELKSGLLNYGI